MDTFPIPESAADVDGPWLTEALTRGGLETDATIVGIDPIRIAEAVGLMGEITRFGLTWDGEGDHPTSVILKVPSVLEENKALGMLLGVYESEHNFYTELATDPGVPVPKCWYSAADAEAGRYALLIEDLTHLDRVDQLDRVDLPTAQACIDALADLHGAWWESDRLAALDWLPEGGGETIRVYRDLVAAGLPAYEEAYADILSDDDRAICHRFVDEYDTLIDRTLDVPGTLMHRDFRIDNILFDEGEPVVLDWGNLARGGGPYDLAYFLSGSLRIEDRRSWGDQLLSRYEDRLRDQGIEMVDFAERHRQFALFCLIVPIMIGGDTVDTRDEKGERLGRAMTERLFAHLHDYEAISALD